MGANYALRQNRQRILMAQWMKLHRPDVDAAIRADVDKVYPLKRKPTAVTLSASLTKLK
jgi:hypothetical protein